MGLIKKEYEVTGHIMHYMPSEVLKITIKGDTSVVEEFIRQVEKDTYFLVDSKRANGLNADDLIADFEKMYKGRKVTRSDLNFFFTSVADYVEDENDVDEMNKAEEYLENKYLKGGK